MHPLLQKVESLCGEYRSLLTYERGSDKELILSLQKPAGTWIAIEICVTVQNDILTFDARNLPRLLDYDRALAFLITEYGGAFECVSLRAVRECGNVSAVVEHVLHESHYVPEQVLKRLLRLAVQAAVYLGASLYRMGLIDGGMTGDSAKAAGAQAFKPAFDDLFNENESSRDRWAKWPFVQPRNEG